MSEHTEPSGTATVDQLRFDTGIAEAEQAWIVEDLRKLDRRLKRYDAEIVDLSLSVKDRDTPEQRMVFELDVARRRADRLVATSNQPDLREAVKEVREDMWRQLDEMIERAIESRRS
ncbi:hypothetical protein ER308_03410 [Egibacter rhizosphaerae]|uniref:HPF/RaiA family ribosome-associated protein n=1 Tax=Egibacter rhizosphaerae TaxID=1670831 RepID=A0A411YBX7_9ACTN|nr:hypothetical protein [Egibacter rhizosphaerae]QBI18696.1 hypothetical protein ER308_03410 [Egibacter rhizosphaerae]